MCCLNDKLESNKIPRLRVLVTEVTVVLSGKWRTGWLTLASCCGNPIKRNSVLDGLRLRKFEVIQDEIEAIFLNTRLYIREGIASLYPNKLKSSLNFTWCSSIPANQHTFTAWRHLVEISLYWHFSYRPTVGEIFLKCSIVLSCLSIVNHCRSISELRSYASSRRARQEGLKSETAVYDCVDDGCSHACSHRELSSPRVVVVVWYHIWRRWVELKWRYLCRRDLTWSCRFK